VKMSIAMSTYNGAVHLPAQLTSIAAQTRPSDEIVVCDDCSSDETRALVEAFAVATPIPVHVCVNERNIGTTESFARAIRLCSGDVIALCDQDDVWRRDKLQLIEEGFARAPAAGLVFSDAEIVDEDLEPLNRGMWAELGFDKKMKKLIENGRALDVLMPGWTVTGATMAFRSKYNQLFLPIPAEIPMLHDGWIALAIASVAEVVLLDEPLIKYRQHASQLVGAPKNSHQGRPLPGPLQAIEAGLRRSTSYSDLRTILSVLQARLASEEDSFDCRNALASIKDYSDHIEARTNLTPGRLGRLPTILRELLGLRYHRFSRGFSSAAKDLVT